MIDLGMKLENKIRSLVYELNVEVGYSIQTEFMSQKRNWETNPSEHLRSREKNKSPEEFFHLFFAQKVFK